MSSGDSNKVIFRATPNNFSNLHDQTKNGTDEKVNSVNWMVTVDLV
jgi:hypothetical protein